MLPVRRRTVFPEVSREDRLFFIALTPPGRMASGLFFEEFLQKLRFERREVELDARLVNQARHLLPWIGLPGFIDPLHGLPDALAFRHNRSHIDPFESG
jgi:hypothetical protein